MATVLAYVALDMLNPEVLVGQVVEATSTKLSLANGAYIGTYYGSGFTYSGETVSGGTLTGYALSYGGQTLYSASGFSVAASFAAQFIQSGNLNPVFAAALGGNDVISGSFYNDVLIGYGGNDILYAGNGTNGLIGGDGIDTAVLPGFANQYVRNWIGDNIVLNRIDGSSKNTLFQVERIQFDDGTLALDTSGNAGQAYRVYKAAFDRAPDAGGLSFWIKSMDNGTGLQAVSQGFINSAEFQKTYGANVSNHDFVQKLYANVLHRPGEDTGVLYWTGQLDSGVSKAQVLAGFSESPENIAGVNPQISDGIWYV